MKSYTITVNGTAYEVTVEENGNAAAPVAAAAPKAAAPAPKAVASNANAPQVEAGISGEVVAAIAAAIAVSEGEGAVVKSIRKVNVVNVKGRNPWANAAVYDNTRPF